MLEKFYLPQTFLSCRHALIGAAQVFAFLGQNFVAALGLFDHVFPLHSFSAEPNGSQFPYRLARRRDQKHTARGPELYKDSLIELDRNECYLK
jgi:hypothetical protein